MYISSVNDVYLNKKRREEFLSWPRFSSYHQKLVKWLRLAFMITLMTFMKLCYSWYESRHFCTLLFERDWKRVKWLRLAFMITLMTFMKLCYNWYESRHFCTQLFERDRKRGRTYAVIFLQSCWSILIKCGQLLADAGFMNLFGVYFHKGDSLTWVVSWKKDI